MSHDHVLREEIVRLDPTVFDRVGAVDHVRGYRVGEVTADGAFGGVGGHSAFGTKTGDFLTWVTVGLVVVFLSLAIAGNFLFEPASLADSTPTISAEPEAPGATPPDTTDPASSG